MKHVSCDGLRTTDYHPSHSHPDARSGDAHRRPRADRPNNTGRHLLYLPHCFELKYGIRAIILGEVITSPYEISVLLAIITKQNAKLIN